MGFKKTKFLLAASSVALLTSVAHAQKVDPTDPPTTFQAHWGDIDGFYGDIDGFYGDIDGFWGDIDGFWGDIDGFWGDIDGFWGDIDGFWGDIDGFWGDIDGFYETVSGFWGDIDGFWGDIDGFWGDIDGFTDDNPEAQELALRIKTLFQDTVATFKDPYQQSTGDTLWRGLMKPLLEKYGLNYNDPTSFGHLSENERRQFFLEFYDGLMANIGVDAVDSWMATVNWSPKVSQDSGFGAGVYVGLLDTPVTNPDLIGGAIKSSGGYGQSLVDHGAGVAGVLAGAHDGQGVMGVAPLADFTVYNPFDDTFTASWLDVANGVRALADEGVGVVNMSLGVSGYVLHSDWSQIMSSVSTEHNTGDMVFVKAAGNDGITQTEDVQWSFNGTENRLLLVGSVGSDGEISEFSNSPGEACLISYGACQEENKLKYRFLVANGENVLVQDNAGNLSRVNGTSLAAPMVSGAVALLQSNWPWLKSHPEEAADIILYSAQDLGEAGVDGVYGYGLLDVGASQEPLNVNDLYVKTAQGDVLLSQSGGSLSLQALLAENSTLTAFENVGSTFRDFEVNVSDMVINATDPEAAEAEGAEKYLEDQFATTHVPTFDGLTTGVVGLNSLHGGEVQLVGREESDFRISMRAHSLTPDTVTALGEANYTTSLSLTHQESGASLRFGKGYNALSDNGVFGRHTDYSMETGGVNPVLSLASGGSFMAGDVPLNDKFSLSLGVSESRDENLYRDASSGAVLQRLTQVNEYTAQAATLGLSMQATDKVRFGSSITVLDEDQGLFGAQGAGALSLNEGATTSALTLDVEARLSPRTTFGATVTGARTAQTEAATALGISDGGLTSTAYQVAVERQGLLGSKDHLRLSVAQPLHIADGSLSVVTTEVIDRETGALGETVKEIALGSTGPRHVTELLYGAPVLDGKVDMVAFGQVQSQSLLSDSDGPEFTGGVRLRLKF